MSDFHIAGTPNHHNHNGEPCEQYPEIRRSMEILLNDQDALGWDGPCRLYEVIGDINAPVFVLLAEKGDDHPIQIIDALWHEGKRVRDDGIAFAVSSEAWMARDFDSFLKASEAGRHAYEETLRVGLSEGIDEEFVKGQIRQAYIAMTSIVAPMNLPDDMRGELRNVVFLMRDGTLIIAAQIRGKAEIEFHVQGNINETDFNFGDVPEAMQRFLAGEHPAETPSPAPSYHFFGGNDALS